MIKLISHNGLYLKITDSKREYTISININKLALIKQKYKNNNKFIIMVTSGSPVICFTNSL